MVDPFRGIFDEIHHLIASKQYFLIHAPRQTGKTTFLHQLAYRLNREGKYTAAVCSLESAGYPSISVSDANEVLDIGAAGCMRLFYDWASFMG